MSDDIIRKVRNQLFLMHEQTKVLTMIADVETMILEKNERVGRIIEGLEKVAELCRIEECYLTDYEMLLEQKLSLEGEIIEDRKYLDELITEYNDLEDELRRCLGCGKN